jgi:hypothetical protein
MEGYVYPSPAAMTPAHDGRDNTQILRPQQHFSDERPLSPTLLRQPGMIGPLRLKNRIIMGPMGTGYATTDGFSTGRDTLYYAERAKGGVAMIVSEEMNVSVGARNHNNALCLYHDQFLAGVSERNSRGETRQASRSHTDGHEAIRTCAEKRGSRPTSVTETEHGKEDRHVVRSDFG